MYQFQLEFWNEFKKIFCYNTGLRHLYEANARPWKKYDRLVDIPIDELKEIIKKENIKTIMIDMDGTLKHRKFGLIEENKRWIQSIKDDVNIYLISNANEELTAKVANELELPFVHKAKKPSSYGFDKICELSKCNKNEVIMIGDAIRADINGAHKAGIQKTILLKDLNIIGLEHGKDEYEKFYKCSFSFIIFVLLCLIGERIRSLFDIKIPILICCNLIIVLSFQPIIKKLYNKLRNKFHFYSAIHILLWVIFIYLLNI